MSIKPILSGTTLAALVALACPAHAGLLGGAVAGGFGNAVGGFGNHGINAAGEASAQGQLNRSSSAADTPRATKAARKVDAQAAGAAQAMTRQTTASGTSTAATKASDAKSDTAQSAGNAAASTSTPAKPANSAPASSDPPRNSHVSGNADQSIGIGQPTATSNGGVDAEHSAGANSLAASGSTAVN